MINPDLNPSNMQQTPQQMPVEVEQIGKTTDNRRVFKIKDYIENGGVGANKSALLTLLVLPLVALTSWFAISQGFHLVSSLFHRLSGSQHHPLSSRMPHLFGSKSDYDTSADWFKNMIPSMSSSNPAPRVIRTPKSWNILYELPGFNREDLKITSDEDYIYIDGFSSCKDQLDTVRLGGDFDSINDKGLCFERAIHAQTTIPRSMHDHGDIQAILNNGLLRIRVPVERERSMRKRVVQLFSDMGRRVSHPMDSAARMSRPMEGTAREAQRKASQGKDQADDYLHYGKETAEDYIVNPIVDTFRAGSEKLHQAGEYVAETADDYIVQPLKDTMRSGEENLKYGRDKAGEYVQYGKETAQDKLRQGSDKLKNARRDAEMRDLERERERESRQRRQEVPVKEL